MSSITGSKYKWQDWGGGGVGDDCHKKTIVSLVMHLCKQLCSENTKASPHKIKNKEKGE
jgi:hypothetical protein